MEGVIHHVAMPGTEVPGDSTTNTKEDVGTWLGCSQFFPASNLDPETNTLVAEKLTSLQGPPSRNVLRQDSRLENSEVCSSESDLTQGQG